MGVIGKKVWFDLWHNKSRTMLAILSIGAGIFAVGAIFGMVDQLLSGMDRAHQAVSPSHISIILRNYIDQSVINELKSIPGVAEIDPVNQISVRYKLKLEEKWKIGTLIERPDFTDQTYDIVELKEGNWPQNGKLGVERLTSQYYEIPMSAPIIFDLGDKERSFVIDGKIRHPFVQPPQFGGQAHFFTDAAGLAEFGVPEGYFGQLLVRIEDPYTLEKAQEVAGDIRSFLSQMETGVVVTLYQEPDKHWGRMFVEGVTLILQIMAIVSLLLSVVLVFNTMMALITQQTDQIGVIKAIGGRSGAIVKIYIIEVLVLGLIALVIALPLSLVFSFYISQSFLNLFNIDYENFVVSQRAVIYMMVAAIVAPVMAAIWPIFKGASMSVREAISTYGLGGDFGNSRFDRGIERIGSRFLPTAYSAALGNMFRRKGRLVFTLLVLTIAGVIFLVVLSLVSSIKLTLDNEMVRQGYDVRIGFANEQPTSRISNIISSIDDIERVEMWYSRNATILRTGEKLKDSAGLGAQLIGIPSNTTMYHPMITKGRWLQPEDNGKVVVINQETAQENNIQVGDEITLDLGNLGSAVWQVVGTYQTVYSTGFVVEPIYAPSISVAQASNKTGIASQLLVKGKNISDLSKETALADSIKTEFENNGIKIDFYTTSAKLDARTYADNQFKTVVNMLINLAVLMAVVGGIGLMGSLGIGVLERTREIGVMRAIGAKSLVVGGIFVMEGVLQGMISFFLSIPLAYFLAEPLARSLGQTMINIDLDYAFNTPAVVIWFVLVLAISISFSMLPARNATRLSVHTSLNYV